MQTYGTEGSESSRNQRTRTENKIERLAFTTSEHEDPFEASRSGDGWDLLEYEYDDEGLLIIGSETLRYTASLEVEIDCWVGGTRQMVDVTVNGPTDQEFFDWVLPLLTDDQEIVSINGVDFECVAR